MRCAPLDGQSGSALIEAVVAIGMLAVLVAAAATNHRVATETVRRAEVRVADVRRAEQELERSGPVGDGPSALRAADAPPACTPTPLGEGPHLQVAVRSDDATGAATAVLVRPIGPGSGPASSGPVAGSLRIHLPQVAPLDPADSAPIEIELRGTDGLLPMSQGPSGCFESRGLPVGTYEVVVRAAGVPLIDRTQVPLDVRPAVVTVQHEPVDVRIDAARPVALTVLADPDGGRPPDDVRPGVLGWLVEGDDTRTVVALGATRAVHPGRIVVVASACANADAIASRRTVEVSGTASSALVPLSTATVVGIGDRTDAVLELLRVHGCADGSLVRPSLRWSGPSEGMRIALPAGVWDARLLSASGAPVTTAARVTTGVDEVQVAIP